MTTKVLPFTESTLVTFKNKLHHLKESFRSIYLFSSVMCHRHTPSSKKIYPRKSSLRNSFELFVWRLRASSPPQTVWKVSTRAEKSVPHYRGDNKFSILGGGNYTFKTVSPCCPPRQPGQVRLPSVRALGWEWKTSGSTASSKEDSERCRLTGEAGIKWRFFHLKEHFKQFKTAS